MKFERIYTPDLGRKVFIRPGTSDRETWRSVFEMRYHVPPEDMPTPHVVLDLGANIGLTAAHYAQMWPEAEIWMVEPNTGNWEIARKNAPRCGAFLEAVGPETGWGFLNEDGVSVDAYTLAQEGTRVRVVSLHDLVQSFGGGGVDFCKMDIEGTEWEVLEQTSGIKNLLVEFHDEPRDYPSILLRGLAALAEQGFEVHHHPPHPAAVFACR